MYVLTSQFFLHFSGKSKNFWSNFSSKFLDEAAPFIFYFKKKKLFKLLNNIRRRSLLGRGKKRKKHRHERKRRRRWVVVVGWGQLVTFKPAWFVLKCSDVVLQKFLDRSKLLSTTTTATTTAAASTASSTATTALSTPGNHNR